MLCAEITSN